MFAVMRSVDMSTAIDTIDRMTANMSDEQPVSRVPTGRLEDLRESRNRAWVQVANLEQEAARLAAELEKAKAAIIRLQRKAWPDKSRGEPDHLTDSDGVR